MPNCHRLTQFDETNSDVQRYITPSENCYYIGDYTMGKGWRYSENNSFNSFISNLKKEPPVPANQLRYKLQAISFATHCLSEVLALNQFIENLTLVPIPSSKACDDANYDDRLMQILEGLIRYESDISISDMLHTPVSRDALHVSSGSIRRNPDDIYQTIALRKKYAAFNKHIVLFDDVITTGASFIACKRRINDQFPDITVSGIFLARSISAEPDFDVMNLFEPYKR